MNVVDAKLFFFFWIRSDPAFQIISDPDLDPVSDYA